MAGGVVHICPHHPGEQTERFGYLSYTPTLCLPAPDSTGLRNGGDKMNTYKVAGGDLAVRVLVCVGKMPTH